MLYYRKTGDDGQVRVFGRFGGRWWSLPVGLSQSEPYVGQGFRPERALLRALLPGCTSMAGGGRHAAMDSILAMSARRSTRCRDGDEAVTKVREN